MWQCKECGKKFSVEPIYCDFCGATDDFLEPVDAAAQEDFYREVESSFNTSVQAKNFHDYDSLIRDFMADEYTPISTKVKEPFEDEERLKKEKAERETKRKTADEEYYDSIRSIAGAESVENDDFYHDLEGMFKEPLQGGDETTFNGIFEKEDTIENTFLRPKKKTKRAGASPPVKGASRQAAPAAADAAPVKRKIPIPLPAISIPKPVKPQGRPSLSAAARPRPAANPRDNMKLLKILGGLGAVLVVMVVLMFTLVNFIVNSGDDNGTLPKEADVMSFFTQVKALDEAAFLANPSMISFYNFEGNIQEKQDMLKKLYALVADKSVEVKGTKSIVQKGINRYQVDFDVKGSKLAVDTLDQLLFRTTDNKVYQLDFTDFVNQYTIASKNSGTAQ